jgi:hypothetical protein
MAEDVVDEVVAVRTGNGATARPAIAENVSENGHTTERMVADGVEQESVGEGMRRGRVFKESTTKLIESFNKPAEAGDDEEAPDPDDEGLVDESAAEAAPAEGEETTEEAAAPAVDVWQEKATKYEEHNRRLLAENEALKRAPHREPTAREKALVEAEQAYVDKGAIEAVRRLIGVVLDSAPDSKDVDAELAGLYTDLTARELNVPLEASQLALREASRTRLALARDKRERKPAEAAPTSEANEAAQIGQAATLIGNRMTMQRESGKSFADDHPLLMSLATDLDGMNPHELVARVIQREVKLGTLDPSLGDDALIQAAAKLVETHYEGVAKKFAARNQPQKTDTTKSKTAPAKQDTEQRQRTATRTITNATASVAPATSPTTKKPTTETKTEERPKFKSKREAQDYALRHLPK